MNRISRFLANTARIIAVAIVVSESAPAGSRTLSLPNYQANPGSIVEVPLSLDNAAGLAALRVQINFDPEVLELLDVTKSSLGEAFHLSRGNGDGLVQLMFARAEALPSGAGRLAVLKLRVNAGAPQGLFSELAIADLGLSDSTGVVDLRQKDTLTTTNGAVTVTIDEKGVDTEHNGLPDWWEQQYGLNLSDANATLDLDGDGLSGRLEYAFGGNPVIADMHRRGIQAGSVTVADQTFVQLGFYRRLDDRSLVFRLQETDTLGAWNDLNLAQQTVGTPQSMGDGTEFVTVRGTISLSGGAAKARGFLRLLVEHP